MGTIKEPTQFLANRGRKPAPIRYRITNTDCWECTSHAPQPQHGHPVIRRRLLGEQMLMARYIYLIFQGSIPENLQVNHTCHSNLCINPDHLYLGTQIDNVLDTKGTSKPFGNKKVPIETRKEIIRLVRSTSMLHREIAEKFGITRSATSRIILGRI